MGWYQMRLFAHTCRWFFDNWFRFCHGDQVEIYFTTQLQVERFRRASLFFGDWSCLSSSGNYPQLTEVCIEAYSGCWSGWFEPFYHSDGATSTAYHVGVWSIFSQQHGWSCSSRWIPVSSVSCPFTLLDHDSTEHIILSAASQPIHVSTETVSPCC